MGELWFHSRGDMAYLGDWCSSDHDCYLLTSGEVTCWKNTCSCPPGEFAQNTTICGSGRPVTGPGQFTSTEPTETSSSRGDHQSPPAVTTETTSSQSTTGPTDSSTGPPTETSSQANTTVQSTTVTVATTETTTSVATNTIFNLMHQSDALSADGRRYLDCTKKNRHNNVLVGIADFHHASNLDAVFCSEYAHLPDLVLGKATQVAMDQLPLRCEQGSVLVGLGDKDKYFRNPEVMLCAPVLPPYRVDEEDCVDLTVSDPKQHWVVAKEDLTDFSKWPFKCPQLPAATGIVRLEYNTASNDQNWFGATCCRVK
ncbi:location of vulva defective 1-like [Amphibalanus amphitrite]|uniref:location of vulva defective 1-like n=1 Tax=Amphibalanus amphitrite TaxID=1232801 RepID=UPI001C905D16|nr:location of vulva defective 1-like [Amphibalanus amphitrite]